MKTIDYTKMSDQELKRYFLDHKDDVSAFYSYLDRKNQNPQQMMLTANELENLSFDQQTQLIAQRLQEKYP